MTFRLPPEWYPQDAVMLTWPHSNTDWSPYLNEVEPVYVEIAHQVLKRQSLLVICHSDEVQAHVQTLLQAADIDTGKLYTFVIPCNDTWARDHGPITLVNAKQQTLSLDFIFNGWGNKYDSPLDNAINKCLLQQPTIHAAYKAVDLVLEGGGVEVDGQGHLLTTENCLLNPNRNPGVTREHIEQLLNQLFGSKKVLWLQHGSLEGDDTDSHIDTLARFAPDNTLVYVQCLDQHDPHFNELQQMERELKALRRHDGQPFTLVPLPMPTACFNQQGERLPATYANFLIINDAVLVPTYRQPELDNHALQQVQLAFPQHDIIAVDCLPLIAQFGSLHCITMQLPQGFLA
ncbi:agmatine deiminase [Thalassolituus sp. HI0120]|jgi:agmatine/peptidylarginine deiminase|nr:agmatine deiminase [Thalassolituus sp. HI0120]